MSGANNLLILQDIGDMIEISAMDQVGVAVALKGDEGSVDWSSPIRSLDQLFAQV